MGQGLYTPGVREGLQQVIDQNLNSFNLLYQNNIPPVIEMPLSGDAND
jgi:hypothetical protein